MSIDRVPVSALGLNDIAAMPDTDWKRPARIVAITEVTTGPGTGTRFIRLADVETGKLDDTLHALGAHRIVERYELGVVDPDDIEHRSFF